MKRILTIISVSLFVCLLPFSMAAAQEEKSEKKIKIIIDDGSGKEVVVDTLIKGDIDNETCFASLERFCTGGAPAMISGLSSNSCNTRVQKPFCLKPLEHSKTSTEAMIIVSVTQHPFVKLASIHLRSSVDASDQRSKQTAGLPQ